MGSFSYLFFIFLEGRAVPMGKQNKDIKFKIEEFIAPITENQKHDWIKGVAKISWNDNPPKLDIRNMNLAENKMGAGISLTDEEVDKLVDILLENDYGSLEAIKNALNRKKSRFTIVQDADRCFDDDDENELVINV